MKSILSGYIVRSRGSKVIAMMSDAIPEAPTVPQLGRVTMYSKASCPFCKKAKELLENQYQLFVHYIDVEEIDRYDMIHEPL